jgi:hypothetical protein
MVIVLNIPKSTPVAQWVAVGEALAHKVCLEQGHDLNETAIIVHYVLGKCLVKWRGKTNFEVF